MTEVDPEAVATAVLACPHVASLSAGTVEEIATYLPGRRVQGIRADEQSLEIHVVARWGTPLPEVGAEVRRAVGALAGGRSITVAIEDLEMPGGAASGEAAT